MLTPKDDEIVASPWRYDNRADAENHFLNGMMLSAKQIANIANPNFPITYFYAYKQNETDASGSTASTGWETFLDGLIRAGYQVTATWPVRTERQSRLVAIGTNALASSIVVAMKKLKLKEDLDGNKTSTVQGIRAACKVMKSRYSKPFEGVQIKIPYETGMDPYSGMVEMLEQKGIIEKTGNKLLYVSPVTGEEIKEFRKGWTSEKLQVIIDEWDQNPKVVPEDVEDDIDETELDDPSVYEENVE